MRKGFAHAAFLSAEKAGCTFAWRKVPKNIYCAKGGGAACRDGGIVLSSRRRGGRPQSPASFPCFL